MNSISPRTSEKLVRTALKIACFSTILGILTSCTHPAKTLESDGGYSVKWLGTAGWQLNYRNLTFLIDPYFSRKSLKSPTHKDKEDWSQLWESDPVSIESALKTAQIERVDGIFVSHSHFDHFGDVPYLTKRFPNVTIYGSQTTCNILFSTQPTAKCVDISQTKWLDFNKMRVKIVQSTHSLIGAKKEIPFPGELQSIPTRRLKVNEYVEGGSFLFYFYGKGMNFLFQGSANFIEKELEGISPTTAVVAPIMSKNIERYHEKLFGKLKLKRALLNHFDNFLSPYSKGVVSLDPVEQDQFIQKLKAMNPSIQISVPTFFQSFEIQD